MTKSFLRAAELLGAHQPDIANADLAAALGVTRSRCRRRQLGELALPHPRKLRPQPAAEAPMHPLR